MDCGKHQCELERVAIAVSWITTLVTLRANFSHINAEWRRVGGWVRKPRALAPAFVSFVVTVPHSGIRNSL